MARLFKPNKFEQDEVGLTIRLSRDMLEEREVLDYLAAMNPKRVQATMVNMLVAGFYHLVKKSHASNREPQIRKKMAEIHQELRSDALGDVASAVVAKPKTRKPKAIVGKMVQPQSEPIIEESAKVEVTSKFEPTPNTAATPSDVMQSSESDDTIPFFLQDGFPQANEPEQKNESTPQKGLSAGRMFGGISG